MQLVTRICVLLFSAMTTVGAYADWIEASDKNTLMLLRSEAQFHPEAVASHGLEEFDSEVMDLGAGLYQRERANNEQLLTQMQTRLKSEKNPRVREDLKILIQSLQDGLQTSQLHRDSMLPFYNAHKSVYYSFNYLLDPRNDPARYPAALVRLHKYVGLETGYTPVSKLAMERTMERIKVPGLLGPYRGELDAELASAQAYLDGIKGLFEASGLQGWESDFALLQTQMAEYHQWLQSELLPRSRDDNQLPPAIYADNLLNFGVRATPEDLIEDALYAYQFIRSEMKALAWRIAEQRKWEDKALVPVMLKLKQEQIPQDKILEIYQQRLAEIEAIIRREDIVTMPTRDASIRLATEAESAAIPAPFMSPPQLVNNTGQYGEFVLVQTNPVLEGDSVMDDWSHDAITWALTLHEARPGHELQFAGLVENGTSLARAIYASNSANAEGWGLYAESIMHQYLPLEGQLFNLFTRQMRAARMFLDPMVNTGQLTPDEAADFLVEQLALSPAMANSEADRYAFRMPGQATAYYYGYMGLMRLRTEVELALGGDFKEREFHDFILQQGLLPPDLLREAVLQHFVGSDKKP
jgi:hypothetical protein